MTNFRALLEAHATSGKKITIDLFTPDRRESMNEDLAEDAYGRIACSPESLKFLVELLIAFAGDREACSFDLHPHGAGSVHFSGGSKLGLFLIKEAGV